MNKIKVLVVEDVKEMSCLLSEHISKLYSYEVVGIAATIADARVMLRHFKPHLMLLDNFLPDGTGLELLLSLRKNSDPVDVLFVTAANNIDTALSAMRNGAFDYMIKPFAVQQINDSLERYYDFHKHITLRGNDNVNQSFVNKLYNTHMSKGTLIEHPKGIDDITLQRILSVLDDTQEYTSDAICDKAGVSKTTARRYLEYAVVSGYLSANVVLGKVGRPQRCYQKVTR
jgi:response regulator of citrate/malate metabolism